MRRYVTLVGLVALLAACGEDQQATTSSGTPPADQATSVAPAAEAVVPVDKAALVEEAKAAANALGSALKGELQTAMKAGGPVVALDVCHTRAPELARTISAEREMQVNRVSLKNRNPVMGMPSVWQTEVLSDFQARKAAGEDPTTLAYAEVVDNEFRFMKAIPTEAVCLNCHGTEIRPEVAAKLNELYPEDKATGFKEGDLRGAFVVTKNLSR